MSDHPADNNPIDHELFHVVFSLHPVHEEFFVAGVFSLMPDAEALAQRLGNDDRYLRVAKIQTMPMPHVIDVLIRDRLGVIADLMAPILAKAALRGLHHQPV